MIRACAGEKETAMWLVCDQRTLAKYGLGYVKPAPMPIGRFLAQRLPVARRHARPNWRATAASTPPALERTVREYNEGAVERRGSASSAAAPRRSTATSPTRPSNPIRASARSSTGPFYAVKLVMGDLGTFDGMRTTTAGEVLSARGTVIRRAVRRRQRPRQHDGRQLPGRRHHPRAEHDVRLAHRPPHRRRPRGRQHAPLSRGSPLAACAKPLVDHRIYTIRAAQDGRIHRGVRPAGDADPAADAGPPLGFWTSWSARRTSSSTCGATTAWPTTSSARGPATFTRIFRSTWQPPNT